MAIRLALPLLRLPVKQGLTIALLRSWRRHLKHLRPLSLVPLRHLPRQNRDSRASSRATHACLNVDLPYSQFALRLGCLRSELSRKK